MTEIKHQHIVPACYLANWGINGNLENFFGVIEGEYAALLQKLLKRIEDRQNINSNKEPLLSTEDKNELTSQFAMQIVRTQAFRSGYEHVWTTLKESFPWANMDIIGGYGANA